MRCIDLTGLELAKRTARKRHRSRFQALLFILGVLSVFAIAAASKAQDAPATRLQLPDRDPGACQELETAARGAAEPTRIVHEGDPGMWFPMPVARLILCQVRELGIRRAEIRLVDQELALWDRQARNFETQAALAVEARNAFQGVVAAAERRAREAEERLDAWYRHPALWFTVGAIVTGALVAVTAYGLDAATP